MGIFLAATSVQLQTPGWTARPTPHCSKGPVRLAVPAPKAERAHAVPGSARLLRSARTPHTSQPNNQPLAARLPGAQPRPIPEAPPPAASPRTPPGLLAPRPPAGPRWRLCNSAPPRPRLLLIGCRGPRRPAWTPIGALAMIPPLPPLGPPRPTLFSHPRCEGRGTGRRKGETASGS